MIKILTKGADYEASKIEIKGDTLYITLPGGEDTSVPANSVTEIFLI